MIISAGLSTLRLLLLAAVSASALVQASTCSYPSNVRKIRVSSTTGSELQFYEFRAIDGATKKDVAFSKAASQSSTLGNNSEFSARNAVDGSTSTFSHTDSADTTSYWEVDLGGAFEITTIDVLNRYCGNVNDASGCLCRLSNATVDLLDGGGISQGVYRFGNTCGLLNPVLDLGTSCGGTGIVQASFSPPTTRPTTFTKASKVSKTTTSAPTHMPTGPKPSKKPTMSPSKQPTKKPSPSMKPTDTIVTGQIDVPIYASSSSPLTVVLPPSTTGTLLTLSQVSDDKEYNIPLSRSYDGFEWEMLHPLLLPVECTTFCNIEIPSYSGNVSMHYIIEEFNPQARTKEQTFAKLLLQGTYGPTQESLQEAIDLGSAAAWVRDQMDMKPTLLREHYRRRTNGYLKTALHHHATRLACESGSRWNRHAFNRWRDVGKTIKEVATGTGSYYLKIDGVVRTEVVTAPSAEFGLPTQYVICREEPNTRAFMSDFYYHQPTGQKGRLLVAADSDSCSNPTAIDMPQVAFTNTQDAFGKAIPSVNLVSIEGDPNVFEARLLHSINPPYTCSDFKKTWPNFVKDASTSLYYVEDRRVELYDNTNGATTRKKRLLDGRCPRTPRTFLNEDTCVPRTDCSPPVYSGEVTLNAATMRKFYEIDERYLYRIQGLPLLDTPSPCDTEDNRFVRKNAGQDGSGCVNTANFPSIRTAIEDALLHVTFDALVIDIKGTDLSCADPNDDALGASFTVTLNDGSLSCWTHTYPHEWSVFVANDWVSNHPGNPKFFSDSKPNPIAYPAEHENSSGNVDESIALNFPPWPFHKYNWDDNRWRFERDIVGSFGDKIAFNDLPLSAQSDEVILALGGSIVADSSAVIEVCGSPGEVANNPQLGHQYLLQKFGDADEEFPSSLDQDHERWYANHLVYNTVSVNAKDQLRHRVAWALSSIFVVTMNQIGREGVEPWAVYYDIFLRNAFGNFFDILKEVTFSPIMAEMLTYKDSKSFSYQVEKNGVKLYPDENFAREIMQLFSIGLYMLHPNGTKIIDEASGHPIPTYSNRDIMNFARTFTNFAHQDEERDNIEIEWDAGWIPNAVDPMYFPASEGRDFFPKQTLAVNGKIGYIGDRVQQCETLIKSRAWLRKGAVYHFRENSQSLLGKKDPDWWSEPDDWSPRLVLDPSSSSLFKKLCNWNASIGTCDFKSTVVLDEDLKCDGVCTARKAAWDSLTSPCECSVEMPRTIRLDYSPTSAPVWFEYVMEPCIQMAFAPPEDLNAVREIGGSTVYGNKAMCANNKLPVAGTVCCNADGKNPTSICVFKGERTTYAAAQDRCSAYKAGFKTCAWDKVPISWDCGTDTAYYQGEYSSDSSPGLRFSWTSQPCSVGVQINADGDIAIIHSVGSLTVKERVAVDAGTYFGAIWKDGLYPSSEANCGGVCQVHGNTCVCNDVAVKTKPVFSQLPTPQDLDKLHIGASDPRLSLDGKYYLCTAPLCSEKGYKVYFSSLNVFEDSGIPVAINEKTVFELTESGNTIFLLNVDSTVEIGTSYSFRNPPMFNSPVDPTQRDSLYETDAVIQHHVNHPNTAPFISTKLINFFITSNPSPRYVQVVSDAFSKGVYIADGQSFGSGRYGDMEALVAAMMLDRESTSTTLSDDSNHGRAREPLIETIHLSRSMKLSTESGTPREIDMIYLRDRGLGQESFNAPSVFSFFLSEFQPVGPVLTKRLRAPETQLFDAPKLINYINGLFSLTQYGLADCEDWNTGFGDGYSRYHIEDYPDGGKFSCYAAKTNNPGVPLRLRYTPLSWGGSTNVNNAPTSAIVKDIDLLLTGGRISGANKAIIEAVYDSVREDSGSDEKALHAVIEHFVAAPEFHITNNLFNSKTAAPNPRPLPDISVPQDPKPVTEYKAIVYMFLSGAMDSFSALVPLNCELHNQYLEVRGDVAITSGLRQIDASGSNQPCDTFGLHPSLVNIHQLFQQRDASFFANIGPLVETMDKYEYEAQSKPQPPALFAHNTQTEVTQTVFAQDSSAGGVLGRIGDALNAQEGKEIFDAYSISGTPKVLEGAPGVSKAPDVLSGWGVSSFSDEAEEYEDNIEALSSFRASSIYGETFSDQITNAIYRTRLLDGVIGNTALDNDSCFTALNTDIAFQYRQVARVIKSRDGLDSKRDVFYTEDWGYDTHDDATATLTSRLKEVDDAIGCFVKEMKSQGIWENTTIVSASEFGRTLTSNGLGTDHAWGANHWIAGGSVKGGKIHGQYPDDLSENGRLNIGRGRLIPTTPWEGMWAGLAEWFGVTSQNIVSVLPNLRNFQSNIFSAADMFE